LGCEPGTLALRPGKKNLRAEAEALRDVDALKLQIQFLRVIRSIDRMACMDTTDAVLASPSGSKGHDKRQIELVGWTPVSLGNRGYVHVDFPPQPDRIRIVPLGEIGRQWLPIAILPAKLPWRGNYVVVID